MLIDARHGLKPADEPVLKMLDQAAVAYQLVLTKTDKITANELASRIEALTATARAHTAAHPEVLQTSSFTGAGIPELRATLAALAEPLPVG